MPVVIIRICPAVHKVLKGDHLIIICCRIVVQIIKRFMRCIDASVDDCNSHIRSGNPECRACLIPSDHRNTRIQQSMDLVVEIYHFDSGNLCKTV